MKGKIRERNGREWMSNGCNAVIFHHRYANDKSTASWSDTGKKTIQNRSERHFHASCSLLYRHPSICILYNRIFPSFSFSSSFFPSIRKQHRDSTGYIVGWCKKRLAKCKSWVKILTFFFYYEKHTMIRYSVGVRENGWNMFEFISKILQRDNIWSLYWMRIFLTKINLKLYRE